MNSDKSEEFRLCLPALFLSSFLLFCSGNDVGDTTILYYSFVCFRNQIDTMPGTLFSGVVARRGQSRLCEKRGRTSDTALLAVPTPGSEIGFDKTRTMGRGMRRTKNNEKKKEKADPKDKMGGIRRSRRKRSRLRRKLGVRKLLKIGGETRKRGQNDGSPIRYSLCCCYSTCFVLFLFLLSFSFRALSISPSLL